MDDYEFPELTIDDFRPLPGDLECVGYKAVLEFKYNEFDYRLPTIARWDPIWVEVEEHRELPL